MTKKKTQKKDTNLIQSLVDALKVDEKAVREIAVLEKLLMTQKKEKLASKQKVTRQKMRSRKFYRHEHTAETIAQLQKLALSL